MAIGTRTSDHITINYLREQAISNSWNVSAIADRCFGRCSKFTFIARGTGARERGHQHRAVITVTDGTVVVEQQITSPSTVAQCDEIASWFAALAVDSHDPQQFRRRHTDHAGSQSSNK